MFFVVVLFSFKREREKKSFKKYLLLYAFFNLQGMLTFFAKRYVWPWPDRLQCHVTADGLVGQSDLRQSGPMYQSERYAARAHIRVNNYRFHIVCILFVIWLRFLFEECKCFGSYLRNKAWKEKQCNAKTALFRRPYIIIRVHYFFFLTSCLEIGHAFVPCCIYFKSQRTAELFALWPKVFNSPKQN